MTNSQFARFVESSGHATEAEQFGWSFVFAGLLPHDFPPTQGVAQPDTGSFRCAWRAEQEPES